MIRKVFLILSTGLAMLGAAQFSACAATKPEKRKCPYGEKCPPCPPCKKCPKGC